MSDALEILKSAGKEFGSDNGSRLAAALTYYTVFALVPLLLLMVAAAGFIFDNQVAVTQAVAEISQIAGNDLGQVLGNLLEAAREQREGALSIGILLAAFSASTLFQQVQGVLNVLFDVPQEKRRSGISGWIINRSIALVSAIGLAVVVLVPVVAVGAIGWLVSLVPASLSWLVPIARIGIPLASFLMLSAVVGLTFQILTPVTIAWKPAIRGGIATAIVGLVAAFGVGIYLDRAGSTGTLGALGGVAIILFFFNLMWIVYIFGGEVTKVYAEYLDETTEVIGSNDRPKHPGSAISTATSGGLKDSGIRAMLIGLALGWFGRRK